MIQCIKESGTDTGLAPGGPTVWGLRAFELHDAFWRSLGVQCVRLGQTTQLQRGAELFLLIEPEQLLVFDLSEILGRLAWHGAIVTRIRLIDEDEQSYREQIVVDDEGNIERITRRYQPATVGACRVAVTRSRRVARTWCKGHTPSAAWRDIRRRVGRSSLDAVKCSGAWFRKGNSVQEGCLIQRLCDIWPDPSESIEGLDQAKDGVWIRAGDSAPRDATLVGPLWLGHVGHGDRDLCLIGPAWQADAPLETDAAGNGNGAARLLDIVDVFPRKENGSSREERHSRPLYEAMKRAFDVVFSAIALVLALPLFVIAAVCILLQDGRPIFFSHLRQTRGGRAFRCWKFRTMQVDSNKEDVAATNECDGPQVFVRNDPRVTRIGHILRRTQIDEIPQFWNVLVGDMSIVGPRPSPDDENQYCPAWRELRLSVRPGITGLWQLMRTRAPGQDFQEWIRYDVEYVRRASFWLDLSICARTAWVLTVGRRS